METPLILGTIRHLGRTELAPFVGSLKATKYAGECVLFETAISNDTKDYLRSNGLKLHHFCYFAIRNHQPLLYGWYLWKHILKCVTNRETRLNIAQKIWDLFFVRFILARNFILSHPEFSAIMLTDVRDVVFQRDPFQWMHGRKGVFCFEEVERRTIGECKSNSRMAREVFGEEGLSHISGFQISCAGVIFGTRTELLGYLERFLDLALNALSLRPCSGSDQGIHNRIVHLENLDNLNLLDNEGPVFTMGCVPQASVNINSKGEVTNKRGVVYPILHQYDRFPTLANRFRLLE